MKVIKGKYELFPLDVFLKKQKTKNNNKESMQKKKKHLCIFSDCLLHNQEAK